MTGLRLFLAAGFVIVSLLSGIAFVRVLTPLVTDLSARVDQQLVDAGQSWASVRLDGQTAILSGTAPTLEAQRLALAAAAAVPGVARVVDGSGILPLRASYAFGLARTGAGIDMKGFVPSEEIRLALRADIAAALPGLKLVDQTSLARGQPVDFLGLARFAVARFAELSDGSATLAGPNLSIDGTARDEASFAAAAAALTRALPPNVELRTVRILPPRAPNFVWRIDFGGARATISGYVPSEIVREEIASALAAAAPGIAIADETRLASGGPEDFGSAAVFAAHQLPRLAEGTAIIDGAVLSLAGKAKSVDDHQAMLADIAARRDRAGDGVTIGAVDIVPPFVDPYVWRASRDAERIVLSGYVPTEAVRDQILEEAARLFPDGRIDSRLAIAAGDPRMDWIGALRFSLGELVLLSKGFVSLTGRRYAIEGEAASTAAFGTLSEQLQRTLPASMELERNAVAPAPVSPFRFSIVATGSGLTLGGYVPDDDMTAALVAMAKPRFPKVEIELRLQRAGGAPEGFGPAALAALQAVSRLAAGGADISDLRLAISGAAVSEDARKAIEAELTAALPASFEVDSSIIVAVGGVPLSAGECQSALDAELAKQEIIFDDADNTVLAESFGLVDRLAAIIQRCPAASIEIGGYTDSAGGAKRNKAISTDEATNVLDRLAGIGVRRERLTAVGYGEARPIASNATAAGRDRNNRIVFTVETR